MTVGGPFFSIRGRIGYHTPMAGWIDVTAGSNKERHLLERDLLRVGPLGCEVLRPGTGGDELQFWSEPPRAVLVGSKTTPLVNGRAFVETDLHDGDSIQWCGAVIVYGTDRMVIEELPAELPDAAPPATTAEPGAAPAVADESGSRAWRRLRAGLLVELGLAGKKEAKRWQEAVVRGEFDPDACAREVLAASSVTADDPRVLERSARLERDLLMAPLQRGLRGASRKARGAARGGLAMVVSQAVAIGVYTLVLFVILLLLRVNNDFSMDSVIDGVLGLVSGAGSDG